VSRSILAQPGDAQRVFENAVAALAFAEWPVGRQTKLLEREDAREHDQVVEQLIVLDARKDPKQVRRAQQRWPDLVVATFPRSQREAPIVPFIPAQGAAPHDPSKARRGRSRDHLVARFKRFKHPNTPLVPGKRKWLLVHEEDI